MTQTPKQIKIKNNNKTETRNPNSETRNLNPETKNQNPKPKPRDSKFENRNPKPTARTPKPNRYWRGTTHGSQRPFFARRLIRQRTPPPYAPQVPKVTGLAKLTDLTKLTALAMLTGKQRSDTRNFLILVKKCQPVLCAATAIASCSLPPHRICAAHPACPVRDSPSTSE